VLVFGPFDGVGRGFEKLSFDFGDGSGAALEEPVGLG